VLQVDLDIGGYLVKLYDTAGLREAEDEVEVEGVRRARMALRDADLTLVLMDGSDPHQPEALDVSRRHVTIATKSDLARPEGKYDLYTSAKTGEGLAELRTLIGNAVAQQVSGLSFAIPNRVRHKDSLLKCIDALFQAINETALSLELRTEYLRVAGDHLGRITGRVDVEQLLGIIFSEFCIGK
jgi:tRNA modification GTPase